MWLVKQPFSNPTSVAGCMHRSEHQDELQNPSLQLDYQQIRILFQTLNRREVCLTLSHLSPLLLLFCGPKSQTKRLIVFTQEVSSEICRQLSVAQMHPQWETFLCHHHTQTPELWVRKRGLSSGCIHEEGGGHAAWSLSYYENKYHELKGQEIWGPPRQMTLSQLYHVITNWIL